MAAAERLRWAKLRIFTVMVSAVTVLTVLIYLLSGGTWLKPKVILFTYIPDSTGLEANADVQLNGVKVGVVQSVRLSGLKDPNRVVQVRMQVEETYLPDIPIDSTTSLDSANMLGDEYVDITMGHSPDHVRAGSVLRFPPPNSMMQNIDLLQFDQQLHTIDQILQDMQQGKGQLGQFIVDDALYSQFLDGVKKVEKQIHAATSSQSQLGQMLYSASMHDQLVASIRQLDDQLARMQSTAMFQSTAQYDRIRDQLAQLRKTLADLDAGPMFSSDDQYNQWNRMLGAWIENLDALASGQGNAGHMLVSADMYEALNGSVRELVATIKEFRANPQRFLRVKVR